MTSPSRSGGLPGAIRAVRSPALYRVRVVIALLLLAIIVMAGTAFAVFRAYQQATWDLVIERDRQLAFLAASRLREGISRHGEVLLTLARLPEVYDGNYTQRRVALDRASPELAVFDGGVVLLDNRGRVRATQPRRPKLHGQDWSNQQFFRAHLTGSGIVLSDAVDDGVDGASVVAVSVPVVNDEGELVGALAGLFKLGWPSSSTMYASIIRLRIAQSGSTFVVDGNRRIIYDSDGQAIGAQLDDRGPVGLPPLDRPGAMRTTDAEGHDVLVAHAPVPGTNWALIVEEDWNVVSASAQRYRSVLVTLMVLGMILPAGGIALMMRSARSGSFVAPEAEPGLTGEMLLPNEPPQVPGWRVAARRRSGPDGGSLHDAVLLPDGRLMVSLFRVPLRGAPATKGLALVRTALRGAGIRGVGPSAALTEAAALLGPELTAGQGACCAVAVVDAFTGEVVVAGGGRASVLLRTGGSVQRLTDLGPPVGSAADVAYREITLCPSPGDDLVLVGDGLLAARNDLGEEFGLDRASAAVERAASAADACADALLDALWSFGARGTEAEATVLVVERLESGAG